MSDCATVVKHGLKRKLRLRCCLADLCTVLNGMQCDFRNYSQQLWSPLFLLWNRMKVFSLSLFPEAQKGRKMETTHENNSKKQRHKNSENSRWHGSDATPQQHTQGEHPPTWCTNPFRSGPLLFLLALFFPSLFSFFLPFWKKRLFSSIVFTAEQCERADPSRRGERDETSLTTQQLQIWLLATAGRLAMMQLRDELDAAGTVVWKRVLDYLRSSEE
jgi:hypothetical protein